MAKSRSSSTKPKSTRSTAAVDVAIPAPARERMSISVRRIANGYVVNQSGVDRKGNYVEHERFTPSRPKIDIKPAKRR